MRSPQPPYWRYLDALDATGFGQEQAFVSGRFQVVHFGSISKMNLNAVVVFGAMGLVFAACSWLWRSAGLRLVAKWCASNSVATETDTFDFGMGRPASASIVGTQGGIRYLFKFTLHSSFLNPFSVWSRVVLHERVPVE
jgi:hypothetical protein